MLCNLATNKNNKTSLKAEEIKENTLSTQEKTEGWQLLFRWKNFILKWDWKLGSNSNSGIMYHVVENEKYKAHMKPDLSINLSKMMILGIRMEASIYLRIGKKQQPIMPCIFRIRIKKLSSMIGTIR
jgi:hypothetical protein